MARFKVLINHNRMPSHRFSVIPQIDSCEHEKMVANTELNITSQRKRIKQLHSELN